jgi:hypothetical protein
MDAVSHHRPDNPISSIHGPQGQTLRRSAGIALLYLILAWVIQAGAVNPFTHLVGGGDAFIQGIAAKTFSTSFCPWNPYVQSGKFVFADVLYQSFYPPSLILLSIFPNTFGFNLFLLIHYAFAGLFVYLYLGSLRLTNYSAFSGGLIFMLCGFMTAHKSHEYILSAAVWLPLTLHFIHRYAERLRVLDLGYAAVPVALSVLAGFPQIALYSTVVAIAYVPFCFAGTPSMQGLKTKVAHIVFAEFVVLGIGGLLGSLPLFSVAATLPAFTRERITYGMFTSDNFPPFQLLTFLIPNLFGGVNRQIPDYAPDTTVFVAEVYAYLGILPLTLALAGLSAWRTARRELKFWSAVAVIALLMSFGGATPIYLLLFHVPVYNLFRVPARHLFEVGLALSVIAAIGLDSLLTPKANAATLARRAFAHISLLLGIAILAVVALRSLAEGWWYLIPDSVHVNYLYTFGAVKQAIIRNLSWNSPTLVMLSLFFALTGGILFLLTRRRLRVTALIAIPILILADTFFAARRMYDNPSTALMYGSASRPESEILRANHFDRDHYRLFPVDFDNGPMARLTSTYHLSTIYPYPLLNVLSALPVINDYGPFWPKRYQAVTGFNAGGGMPIANLQNYKMLSFLGTRYLMVLSAETRQAIEKVTLNIESGRGAAKVFSPIAATPNGITIFENPTVLPRFRFVHRIRAAQDLDDALSWMNRPDFNPAEEAVVEGINTDMQMAPGNILGEKLEATELQWEVETSGRSFFVVADSFFPGWTATVDGQPAPIYAVYGCVRGIQIQTAGRHRVEMRFAPPGLAAGLACSSAGFLILCLLWLGDRTGHLTRIPLGRHLRSSHPRYKEDAV